MALARKIISATCVALAALIAWNSFAATPAAPATAAAASRPTDPFAQEFLRRLESPDATERDAARKELGAIAGFWQEPQMLEKLIEVTADPQLKELFKQRLAKVTRKIKENVASNELDPNKLPPISLAFRDLSFKELPDVLNDALKVKDAFDLNGTPPLDTGTATFDLHDKPLWEVLRAAQRVQPISVSGGASFRLFPVSIDGWANAQIHGPALLMVTGIPGFRRSTNVQLDGDKAHSYTATIALTLMVDPRVSVAAYAPLVVSRVTDDAGHTLRSGSADVPAPTPNATAQANFRTQSTAYELTADPGKCISLVCDTKVVAITSRLTSTIPDVQSTLDTDVEIGSQFLRVTRFTIAPGPPKQVALQVTLTPGRSRPDVTARADLANRVQLKLLAADGKIIWSQLATSSTSASVAVENAPGPYTLTATVPEKTVDLPFHFELKDIPLP